MKVSGLIIGFVQKKTSECLDIVRNKLMIKSISEGKVLSEDRFKLGQK